MDKELLKKYKEQNPVKFAQKFGHINLDDTPEPKAEDEKKNEVEVEAPQEIQ